MCLGLHWGNGLPADREEASKWYKKAAEQGLDNAQCPGNGFLKCSSVACWYTVYLPNGTFIRKNDDAPVDFGVPSFQTNVYAEDSPPHDFQTSCCGGSATKRLFWTCWLLTSLLCTVFIITLPYLTYFAAHVGLLWKSSKQLTSSQLTVKYTHGLPICFFHFMLFHDGKAPSRLEALPNITKREINRKRLVFVLFISDWYWFLTSTFGSDTRTSCSWCTHTDHTC